MVNDSALWQQWQQQQQQPLDGSGRYCWQQQQQQHCLMMSEPPHQQHSFMLGSYSTETACVAGCYMHDYFFMAPPNEHTRACGVSTDFD
jgi:hypothetical protein